MRANQIYPKDWLDLQPVEIASGRCLTDVADAEQKFYNFRTI